MIKAIPLLSLLFPFLGRSRYQQPSTGIPQKMLDKSISHSLHQTNRTGNRVRTIIKLRYVKAHNGELKVETKEGEGGEFIITIPVNKPQNETN